MEPQFCANPNCPKHTVHTGGKFRVRLEDRKTFCEDCYCPVVVANSGKNLWDFTTTHFDATPVHVRSLAHLRELEKKHGVSNHAANYETRNW